MSTIPASLFVSVTPSVLAAGGSALDLNGRILTTSTRVPIGAVMSFPDGDTVGDFFGSTSSRTRCNALALLRRAGTQQATALVDAWAPALQRTAEALRRVRGTRLLVNDTHD